MNESKLKRCLPYIPFILTAILQTMKTCGIIDCDVFWIVSPIILAMVIYMLLNAIVLAMAIIIPWLDEKIKDKE